MAGRRIDKAEQARIKTTIVAALSVGAYQKDACDSAGISEDTFKRWEQKDAEFAERVSRARPQGWIADLAAIRTAALAGDWRAAEAHLALTGSPYRKTERIEHTGKDGAPLTININRVSKRSA